MQLKLNVPIITTPYAARPDIIPDLEFVDRELSNIPNFNFLTVAQWGPRKNVEATLKAFVEEFKDEEDVGLILKVNIAKNNVHDKMATKFRLSEFLRTSGFAKEQRKCKVFLLHGHLNQRQIRSLFVHPKIKALITTSHGEGFGLSQFEAAFCALSQAIPAYSGPVDFLYRREKDSKTGKMKLRPQFKKIDYDMKNVQPEAIWNGVIQPDAMWAWVKHNDVKDSMRELFKNYGPWKAKAKYLQEHVLEEFEAEKMYKHFVQQIIDCLPALPIEPDQFKLDQEIVEKNILNDIIEV